MYMHLFLCVRLFQMLSLKWRRCQYNVEQSNGKHAAESELSLAVYDLPILRRALENKNG